ncbi:hypothetical protein WHR41_08352 [Cladosporium halotolerans]|uniref:DNL-type domain-containing protein n=1 Tax=Cladosporium halotolerans TaxID=1052096 RepID=A0AB34KCJ3_9PEZI
MHSTRPHSVTMNSSTALRALSRASQQTLRPRLGLQRTFAAPPVLLRKPLQAPQASPVRLGIRFHSTDDTTSRPPKPLTDRDGLSPEAVQSDKDAIAARKAQQPSYELTFTCKKCLDRSSHRITKQAYHFGTVLVNCPGCKSRHLIADHMKIFSDTSVTIEDIMKEKGEFIQKGSLGADGDVEFYDASSIEDPQKPT